MSATLDPFDLIYLQRLAGQSIQEALYREGLEQILSLQKIGVGFRESLEPLALSELNRHSIQMGFSY